MPIYATMVDAADWAAKLAFMREGGVTEAEWDGRGSLVRCLLGPDPKAQLGTPTPKANASLDKRAMLLGATSRLVPTNG